MMEDDRSNSSQAGRKLKDSCDMCSASKVRCNKEKPACARCIKLEYPCFYSPARRVGRPYPQRATTMSPKLSATATISELTSHIHRQDQVTIIAAPNQITSGQTDCSSLALDSLEQMDEAKRNFQVVANGAHQGNTGCLHTLMSIITTAFKRISTILICPCSERPEVGILVASLCTSMLDVHETILCKTNAITELDMMDPFTNSTADQTNSSLKVLRELSKVAKSVIQFTNKYERPDDDVDVDDLLPALSGFLRTRLRAIARLG